MPIYEFVCLDCSQAFEKLVLTSGKVVEVTCPTCQSQNVTKKISTFASRLAGGGSFSFSPSSSSSCNTGSV
jgi:putative FmdB family regulatory protein